MAKPKPTWVTTSQVVEREACELVDAIIVATSAGAADATIYDGHNTTGTKLIKLSTTASTMGPLHPNQAIYLDRGLFVEIGSNVEGVLVLSRRPE